MHSLRQLTAEQRAEILEKRLARSERALRDAEAALESRMVELFNANQELRLRESELAQRLGIESSLLLGALATARMATVYGEEGREFHVSDSAGGILGLKPNESVSFARIIDTIHPLDRQRMLDAIGGFFSVRGDGVSHHYVHRIIRANDGEVRWLSWSTRREKGRADQPAYLLATFRDITEERRNERRVRALQLRAERRVAQLNRLRDELTQAKLETERSLQSRIRLISEMAHAIRTALAGLSGGLGLLGGRIGGDDSDLKVAQDAADQLGEIASRLIEEAGAQDFSPARSILPAGQGSIPGPTGTLPENPRVLVAEDTESNRYVLERLLGELGCETVMVENGAAAVEAVRRSHFDVVLMDVMMPIMNGEQATQAIRALNGPAARTPIVGITAHSLQAERERLLASGMTACLPKPVKRDALQTAINTALIARESRGGQNARFDHQLFRRTFDDLPPAYRTRMRDAARTDITRYASEVLAANDAGDEAAMSRAAHSLKGVALNVGAVGIVEELTRLREGATDGCAEDFRAEVAECLLSFDDLFDALIDTDQ